MNKIATSIFDFTEKALIYIFDGLEDFIKGAPKGNEGYTASFAPTSTLLSSRHTGFCLTGDKSLEAKRSFQNSIVFGGTGVGKSTVVLLPSLYSMNNFSFVVHDPSSELFLKSSAYLESIGYTVKVLNFSDPSISCGYNPLAKANTSSEINRVAQLLISTSLGSNNKDQFWSNLAQTLIFLLISILKKGEPKYCNLFNVRMLLNQMGGSPEKIDKLFSEQADEILFSEYKSFVSYDDKVVSGVIATCKSALQIFADDSVVRVTSHDEIDFQEFRDKKVALYIQCKTADQKYLSVLTSLLFEEMFAFSMSKLPAPHEKPIALLIDEAGSLKLPMLQLAVANCRKFSVAIMCLYQSWDEVIHCYTKHSAEAIKANCFAKMYFTGQNLDTSTELEKLLGKHEYKEKNKEGREETKIRSLLTADEIRTLKITEALLICGHHLPLKIKLRPYYENKTYLRYSTMPVPPLQSNIPETVAILPLPEVGTNE